MTARALVAKAKREGGRIYRMRERLVFVLTENPELAAWLSKLGGMPYLPYNATPTYETPLGAFRNAKGGVPKWDIYIHAIPTKGEQTVWEAAGLADAELFEL